MTGTRRILFLGGMVFPAVLLPIILWGTTCDAAASERGDPAEPRCAFVVEEWSEVTELTEAKLRERPSGIWLERNEIDRVLAEQELAASFAPDSARQRIAIGQLLKADVLVLLHTERIGEDSPANRIDLVVAETNGGLRILAHSLPISSDVEADADKLVALVDKAMAKYGETIREIYAVPPFLSRDLGNENDHLMSAYAALVEHVLLAQSGVLVVETAEAEAIAREYALADPGKHVERPLPIYLLGEYRHDGHGDNEQITIRLETRRGKTVLDRSSHTMHVDEPAIYLTDAAMRLVGNGMETAAVLDANTEAQGLSRRCAEFVQLRDWNQALRMAEASLLLVPDQVNTRTAAILALSELKTALDPEVAGNQAKILRLHCRSFEHLKHSLAGKSRNQVAIDTMKTVLGYSRRSREPLKQLSPDCRRQTEIERDFALKHAYDYADEGIWNKSRTLLAAAVTKMSISQEVDERLAYLKRYQHKMDRSTKAWSININYGGTAAEAHRLRDTVLSWQELDEELRNTVLKREQTLREWPSYFQERHQERLERLPTTPAPVTFRSLDTILRCEYAPPVSDMSGLFFCLPLDDGSDVFWSPSGPIFHVTQPNRATDLWKSAMADHGRCECLVVSDGHYVWVVRAYPEEYRVGLIMLEPGTGRSWPIGEQHGLPPVQAPEEPMKRPKSRILNVAALERGEAIVAGYNGDTWLAHVRLDKKGHPVARVIHEAKEIHTHQPNAVANINHDNSWQNSRIAFLPNCLVTWTGGESSQRWVVINRLNSGWPCHYLYQHPLIVSSEDLSISVMQNRWDEGQIHSRPRLLPTQIYPRLIREDVHLMRISNPEQPAVSLRSGIHDGIVIQDETTVHVVGEVWQRGDLSDGSWEVLGLMPWQYLGKNALFREVDRRPVMQFVGRSNVYGFVAAVRGVGMLQILFDGSGASFDDVRSSKRQRMGKHQ